jgi:hypothetical protein
MRSDLSARVSLASDPTLVQGWQDQAMREAVDSCWWRIQDVTFADLPIDNITLRWGLLGEDVTVLSPEYQVAPFGVNTGRISGPATPPVVSASGSGSTLAAGTYRCAIAYETASGDSTLSPVTTVILNAGQNLVFAALVLPAGTIPITAIVYYYTDANDVVWKTAATTGTGAAKTISTPGSVPKLGKPFVDYVDFSAVSWIAATSDRVIVEQQVLADGTQVTNNDPATCSVAAIAAPAVAGGSTAVRVWYQRRVPQPDYSAATSLIRAPEQFMRLATLGYYLGILSDNQPGGDIRQWRKKSDEYLQQAQILYEQATPLALQSRKQHDDWLVTGRPG